MAKYLFLGTLATALALFTNCKKQETTSSSNIASQVVQNLTAVSNGYTPASLASNTTSGVKVQNDPCAGVSDFAVCQSNLIREYLRIGKSTVDTLSTLAAQIGARLGEVPDGNSGTSGDGKVSWNKTSADVWSVLLRGTGGNPVAYLSINSGVYTLKVDQTYDESNPTPTQLEATVNFTDSSNWTVDVYFGNDACNSAQVSDPSKAEIKLSKASGLWTGKAMIYVPRWQAPGATAPTCGTAAGAADIAMYTDFVGNDTSTKAALYLIPTTENNVGNINNTNFALPAFCTNWPSACGTGTGQIPVSFLNSYPNNWCTTGPSTNPTWGSDCASNAAVTGAAYSNGTNWIAPNTFKSKSVTVPSSL